MTEDQIIVPDAPIESSTQDALGRTGFAQHIARALTNLLQGPGIVVGLNGPWGSGKSSVKNLILEEIRSSKAPVEIVEFNPWLYESASQLTKEFFEELAIAATSSVVDEDEKRERRAKFWKYGSRVAKVGAAGLSAFLPVIGVAVEKSTKELIDQISKVMEDTGAGLAESVDKKSLTEIKKDLAADLAKLERPILVVIDDIDRLDGDEIKLLFKLVKANADFPKVSYLLLFARDRVVNALSGSAEDGSKFLEKIVTVAFDIPSLTRKQIVEVFNRDIQDISFALPLSSQREGASTRTSWKDCIHPYLDTLRSVKRFTNMLRFSLGFYREDAGLNVNFIDLALIESLRVFEPTIFKALAEMQAILTEDAEVFFRINRYSDSDRISAYLKIFSSANKLDVVVSNLGLLFPQVDWKTGSQLVNPGSESDLQRRRITRSAYFERYFAFDFNVGTFTESQYQELLDACSTSLELSSKFESFDESKYRESLQMLLARSEEIPTDRYEAIFDVLYHRGENAPAWDLQGTEARETNVYEPELLFQLAKRARRLSELRYLVVDLAEKNGAIYLPALVVGRLVGDLKANEGRLVAMPYEIANLKKWTIAKITALAGRRTLITHPRLLGLLGVWEDLTTPDKPRAWITSLGRQRASTRKVLERIIAPKLKSRKDVLLAASDKPVRFAEDMQPFQAILKELSKENLPDPLRRAVEYGLLRNRGLNEVEKLELRQFNSDLIALVSYVDS